MTPATGSRVPGTELDRRRLVWHCRRGMKELDVLLERYVRTLGEPSVSEAQTLERFLNLPDPALAGYLLGHEIPEDPEIAALILRISCCAPATGREL
jgi:antitoxin CptB